MSESGEQNQSKTFLNKYISGCVDYCDVFFSCLDSHFDGTHSLQMINLWENEMMQNYYKCVLMNKQKLLVVC